MLIDEAPSRAHSGSASTTALPVGAMVLGAGVSAIPLSRVMARLGRARGLRAGYLIAAGGAGAVVLSALSSST